MLQLTHLSEGGRNFSRLFPNHISLSNASLTGRKLGRVKEGAWGGIRTRKPQIVVRFFISLPHLNLQHMTYMNSWEEWCKNVQQCKRAALLLHSGWVQQFTWAPAYRSQHLHAKYCIFGWGVGHYIFYI